MSKALQNMDAPMSSSWKPVNPGDLIEGKVTRVDSRDAGYGEYPILTLEVISTVGGEVDGGEPPATPCTLSLHCLGAVLTAKVYELGVREGDDIAARYDGMKTGKNGNDYKAWSFGLDRPSVADKLPAADAHADLFR